MQCNKAIFTKPYISVVVLSLFSPTDLSVSCACRYVCHFKFSFFFVSEKLSGSVSVDTYISYKLSRRGISLITAGIMAMQSPYKNCNCKM